jgi:hypothetical protein
MIFLPDLFIGKAKAKFLPKRKPSHNAPWRNAGSDSARRQLGMGVHKTPQVLYDPGPVGTRPLYTDRRRNQPANCLRSQLTCCRCT